MDWEPGVGGSSEEGDGEDFREEYRERQPKLSVICGIVWKPNTIETFQNI